MDERGPCPPPRHVLELFAAAASRPAVAERIGDGFDHPPAILPLWESPAAVERLLAGSASATGRNAARVVLQDLAVEHVQREADGVIPTDGASTWRNVLESRVDPASGHADPWLGRVDASPPPRLQVLGLRRGRTDLELGFQAWSAAGLPVDRPTARPARRTPRA